MASQAAKRARDLGSEEEKANKKQRRDQTYKAAYHRDFSFITSSRKGECYAFCTLCRSDFSIAHSGRFDIKRHEESKSHKTFASAAASTTGLKSFFKSKNAEEESDKRSLQLQITRAETVICQLIADCNLSLATADKLTHAVKSMFPDSKIASGVQCCRNKATAMIKKIAASTQDSLRTRMKTAPFSISTDGSNDADSKQFPIVVRTLNPDTGLVQSELLSVPVCTGSGTGENIFRLVEKELHDSLIPWKNCLSLGCDNAPVMTGRHKGVYAFMKEQQPDIYLSGCTLHIVHNASKKAAGELPPIDAVLVDIFYYFNKSADRQQRFKGTQVMYDVEQKKILKHVCTRWLSIGKCLARLLENWDPLKVFFKEEVDKLKGGKASSYASGKAEGIFTFMRSPTNQLYTSFLLFVVKSLEPFLLAFQAEEPKIHMLRRSIQRLLKQVLVKFIKPSAMPPGLPVEDVDFRNPHNQKDDCSLSIGEKARQLIADKAENHLRDSRLKEFFSCAKKYYVVLMDYLISHLPHTRDQESASQTEPQPSFLSLVEVTDVDLQLEVNFNTLRQLLLKFPVLLPPGTNVDTLSEQFALYQCSDLSELKTDRLDETWANIGKNPDFSALSQVMRGILVIPHSSAPCERIFSCVRKNKTSQRSCLSNDTLESLLVLKNGDKNELSDDTLKELKSAYVQSLKQ